MHEWWHSWGRLAAIIAGSVLGVLVLFVAFCLATPPGHAVLASLIEPLSGGSVAIEGLSGALPNHLRAKRVELRDVDGTWLKAEGVRLDWHFLSILGNHVNVSRLQVDHVSVLRRQVSKPTTTTSTTTIDVADLAVGRIDLNPSVLGRPAVLTAKGSLHYASRHDVAADLTVRRLDGPGQYDVHAAIVHDIARGTISVNEGGAGLAGGAVGMPDLGPVSLDVRAAATGSNNTIRFKLGADLLDVFGGGTFDLAAKQADIDFSVVAPEMHPNKQLSWSTLSARGHIHGSFARPNINADVKIVGLTSGDTRIGQLSASLKGAGGSADLQATLAGLRLPADKKGVLASSPLQVAAHIDLAAKDRPVRFTLDHPLLKVAGQSTTQVPVAGRISVTLPSLDRLSGLTGVNLAGNAALAVAYKQGGTGGQANVTGTIATQGATALAKLLGTARLAAKISVRDPQNLSLQASLKGADTSAQVNGGVTNGVQDFSSELAIADLSRAVGTLTGKLTLRGRLTGPANNGKLIVNGTADAAPKGMPKQGLTLLAQANGLPKLTTASLRVSGRFGGAPVVVKADLANAPNALKVALTEASWRSARAQGQVLIAGSQPRGTLSLRVSRLADLAPLVGTALSGSLDAHADFQNTTAVVHATGQDITSGATRIDRLELNGSIANPLGSPNLALTLSAPKFASGALSGSADAKLNGPMNALRLTANSNLSTSNGQNFTVTADALADTTAKRVAMNRLEGNWQGQTVKLAAPTVIDYSDGVKFDATFVEGKAAQLTIVANIPAKPGASMNVRANGTADLGIVAATLASVGEVIRGKMALNVTVTGTTAKPQIVGMATITNGQIQDYPHGVNLTDVDATAEARGTDIRLTKFTAKAGPGTITGGGTVNLSAPGTPVNMTFKATNARPISSDLMSLTLDSDLKLQGKMSEHLVLAGKVNIRRGNINLPEKFPTEVATLNVRHHRIGPPPPPPPPPARVSLDLTVDSPGQIFVRGRGLEAELEGELKVQGTTSAPLVLGALTMRRGTLSLAGANLTFKSGKISFNGEALRQRLDPSIEFVAESEANGVTATLKISGTASRPKMELSSSPPLPQDEILAQLLFGQSAKSLSAMQLASVAQAAASLGGGGGGFDPVGAIRKSLGLDRLAVGSTPSANGGSGSTTVEAGKYILRNVYLAARQDISGGTRALVQVDLTKHLKAQAQVNTGPRAATTTSTPLQDNGDSIGLSYQFEY